MIIGAEDLTVVQLALIEVKERHRRQPVRVVENRSGAAPADVERCGGRTGTGHRMKRTVGDPQHGDALFTAAVDAAQQMIIVDDRVRPLAKCPLWCAELRLCYTEGSYVAFAPQVEDSTSSYDRK